METSTLNAAHARERRAEALLQERKFEEAAECHERAANLFSEAHAEVQANSKANSSPRSSYVTPSSTSSPQSQFAVESLVLQRDYHQRQAAIVRMKQVQFQEYKSNLEAQQQEFLAKQSANQVEKGTNIEPVADKTEASLRQAIYRTIDEHDSLLGMILVSQNGNAAFKHPKDDGTVVEELRTINTQLRSLIENLLGQLEARERQVQLLKGKLQAISPSSEDDATPVATNHRNSVRLSPLPPLAPLEMPLFDFTAS